MKKGPLMRIFIRWFICSLGLWVAAGFLGGRLTYNNDLGVIIVSGLVLALVNMIIRPVIVLLSLPFILFSLGLFVIVINGLMVFIASRLYDPLHVSSFGAAMLAGIIIGLVNYLVTTILEDV